jgi:hypothetical protein
MNWRAALKLRRFRHSPVRILSGQPPSAPET